MLFETRIKKIVEFISVNGVKRAVSHNWSTPEWKQLLNLTSARAYNNLKHSGNRAVPHLSLQEAAIYFSC